MRQFLNLSPEFIAGKFKFEDPCMPASISLLFVCVTRALQDPMNLSAFVNLNLRDRSTSQIRVCADFHFDELACGSDVT
jgi:hypothetical protein